MQYTVYVPYARLGRERRSSVHDRAPSATLLGRGVPLPLSPATHLISQGEQRASMPYANPSSGSGSVHTYVYGRSACGEEEVLVVILGLEGKTPNRRVARELNCSVQAKREAPMEETASSPCRKG